MPCCCMVYNGLVTVVVLYLQSIETYCTVKVKGEVVYICFMYNVILFTTYKGAAPVLQLVDF